MNQKRRYDAPRLETITFLSEQILDASPGFPELPDHDWVKSNQVQVFPEGT